MKLKDRIDQLLGKRGVLSRRDRTREDHSGEGTSGTFTPRSASGGTPPETHEELFGFTGLELCYLMEVLEYLDDDYREYKAHRAYYDGEKVRHIGYAVERLHLALKRCGQ